MGGAEIWDREPTQSKLETMQHNRYVFIVGSDDSNRRKVREVAAKYAAAGIENIEMMIISRRGHDLPVLRDMSDALNYLDAVPDS